MEKESAKHKRTKENLLSYKFCNAFISGIQKEITKYKSPAMKKVSA